MVSPYSAAYGGGATGFLNTVTKSGADSFYADAFYFNRNSGTGANDSIDKAAGRPRPTDIMQQFGGALGGPVVRNKAWFYFDYEDSERGSDLGDQFGLREYCTDRFQCSRECSFTRAERVLASAECDQPARPDESNLLTAGFERVKRNQD